MIFEDSAFYTGPAITGDMVLQAEARLGYALPASYLALLEQRNGGRLLRRCVRTPFATSWAPDHFEIEAILGIGGRWGIDSDEVISSPAMTEEWGYPKIGIVICEMPSAGHDAVMLDYRHDSQPAVAYIDEDRVPRVVAPTFAAFVDALVSRRALGVQDGPDTPEGYTWHHDHRRGVMQMVSREVHRRTGHTDPPPVATRQWFGRWRARPDEPSF